MVQVKILVIKNFKDKELDAKLSESGIRIIYSEDESLGGKMAESLSYCKGDVISFLEDDDFFHEHKLESIEKAFMEAHDLGYYHNDFFEIDAEERPLNPEIYKHLTKALVLKTKEDIRDSILMLSKYKAIGHNSSITVRKVVLERITPLLPGLNQYIDNFLFFSFLRIH